MNCCSSRGAPTDQCAQDLFGLYNFEFTKSHLRVVCKSGNSQYERIKRVLENVRLFGISEIDRNDEVAISLNQCGNGVSSSRSAQMERLSLLVNALETDRMITGHTKDELIRVWTIFQKSVYLMVDTQSFLVVNTLEGGRLPTGVMPVDSFRSFFTKMPPTLGAIFLLDTYKAGVLSFSGANERYSDLLFSIASSGGFNKTQFVNFLLLQGEIISTPFYTATEDLIVHRGGQTLFDLSFFHFNLPFTRFLMEISHFRDNRIYRVLINAMLKTVEQRVENSTLESKSVAVQKYTASFFEPLNNMKGLNSLDPVHKDELRKLISAYLYEASLIRYFLICSCSYFPFTVDSFLANAIEGEERQYWPCLSLIEAHNNMRTPITSPNAFKILYQIDDTLKVFIVDRILRFLRDKGIENKECAELIPEINRCIDILPILKEIAFEIAESPTTDRERKLAHVMSASYGAIKESDFFTTMVSDLNRIFGDKFTTLYGDKWIPHLEVGYGQVGTTLEFVMECQANTVWFENKLKKTPFKYQFKKTLEGYYKLYVYLPP